MLLSLLFVIVIVIVIGVVVPTGHGIAFGGLQVASCVTGGHVGCIDEALQHEQHKMNASAEDYGC